MSLIVARCVLRGPQKSIRFEQLLLSPTRDRCWYSVQKPRCSNLFYIFFASVVLREAAGAISTGVDADVDEHGRLKEGPDVDEHE